MTDITVSPKQQERRGYALGTQLSALLIMLAVLTFATTVWVSTGNMRTYLDAQLSRSAQDTANSLGLAISPYIGGDDSTVVSTMIAAIFDSGYYLHIQLTDPKQREIVNLINPTHIQGVPEWFVKLMPLEPPNASSEVNDGWQLAGTLTVQAHPGYAYASLWNHTKDVFWTSLLICLLALMAVHLLLLAVLKPLKDIERQAAQLADKRFEFLDYMPLTTELRTVVKALNHMVGHVKRNFAELNDRAEQLNKQVFIDSLTGLPNRRALVQSYSSLQAEPADDADLPYMALIALSSLKTVNDTAGYAAGDEYVQKAAGLLQSQLKPLQHALLFRISGSEFAILTKLGTTSASEFLLQLRQAFSIAEHEQYPTGFAAVSLLAIERQDELAASLMKLDAVQARPQPAADLDTKLQLESTVVYRSRSDWQEILHHFSRSVVNDTAAGYSDTRLHVSAEMDKMFSLQVQPVFQGDDILYVETFIRFHADGEDLAPTDVFAMADRLGVSLLLDKALVTFILHKLKGQTGQRFAINLSKSAMHDQMFVRWLGNTIAANRHQLPELVFEVNEQATLGAVASAAEFFDAVKQMGAAITIERFGASFSSFRYLQGLNVDYIKIDGSYIRALQQNDTRFFVETMTHICHGIGIRVIASHVEDKSVVELCQQLRIDALQGHALHLPVNFSVANTENKCVFTKVALT